MFAHKRGLILIALCLEAALYAGPTLTTIQDTIYNADGSPYNGIAIIQWTPFVAGGTSQIATQSVTVNISGGSIFVQLVPTTNATPAGYYSVTFTSSGNDQFTETWSVPPSTKALTIAAVLMSSGTGTTPLTSGTQPIPESSVIGLVADLGARPPEGASYTAGAAAIIDSTGAIGAATGSASDCVHVDGSSGPCGTSGSGAAGPNFTDGEVPSGAVNGANASFTLSAAPAPPTSLALYRNGVLQKTGLDYTLAGNTVQFTAASIPQNGDMLVATYRVTPSGAPQGPPAPQILCAGMGSATSATTLSTLATCAIAPGTIQPGDRISISFDYSHEGTITGFTFAVDWGNTLLVQRAGSSSDVFITGRAEAGANTTACQMSFQSWGTVLGFAAGVLNAYDSLSYPINLAFKGQMAATTTDTVTLRNFTVVRYPATQ